MEHKAMSPLLTCLSLLYFATFVTAAPLVKIKCLGNNKFVTVTSSTLYANKTGVGSYGVFYKEDLGSNVFALKCPSTGTYVTVGAGSTYVLTVGSATTPGTNEKFTQVLSSGNWAMLAMRNSKYVTGNTTGNKLQATKTTIGNYERYVFTEVVDMYLAMNAWQTNYSTKYKLADTSVWPNYNTNKQMYIHDEQQFSSGAFWIYEEFRNRDLSAPDPVWNYYGVRMIGNWEVVCCYKTVPLSAAGLRWAEGIPRCYRYLEPAYVGNTSSQTVNWWNIGANCVETSAGSGSEYGKQKAAQALDLSNPISQENMGSRWTVDIGYKDDLEYWTVDIGPYDANQPTTVIINPKYGIVRYYRIDPANPSTDTYSEFTNIQDKWGPFGNRCP